MRRTKAMNRGTHVLVPSQKASDEVYENLRRTKVDGRKWGSMNRVSS